LYESNHLTDTVTVWRWLAMCVWRRTCTVCCRWLSRAYLVSMQHPVRHTAGVLVHWLTSPSQNSILSFTYLDLKDRYCGLSTS